MPSIPSALPFDLNIHVEVETRSLESVGLSEPPSALPEGDFLQKDTGHAAEAEDLCRCDFVYNLDVQRVPNPCATP